MDTKLKKRANASWLNILFGPIHLNFIAPFSLEASFELLKQQESTLLFQRKGIVVDLVSEDADTFGFSLKGRDRVSGTLEVQGYLKRWETDSTLVNAEIHFALVSYLLLALGIAPIPLMFDPAFEQAICFIFPLAIIAVFQFGMMRRQRRDLADLIAQALHAELVDRRHAPSNLIITPPAPANPIVTPDESTPGDKTRKFSWLGPVDLDFVTPFPLETSIERLQREDKTGSFRNQKTWIKLSQQDPTRCDFYLTTTWHSFDTTTVEAQGRMKRRGGNSTVVAVEAQGYMKRREDDSTAVTVSTDLSGTDYIGCMAWAALGSLPLIAYLFNGSTLGLLLILIGVWVVIFYLWTVNRQRCHDVARLIEEMLRAEVAADTNQTTAN